MKRHPSISPPPRPSPCPASPFPLRPIAADVVDTAVAAGNFKTLVAAVQAAGLVDTLKGKGPFTVFAPTDEAFAKLPAGTVETLLKPENKDKLVAILTYHVVPGKVMAADVAGKETDGQDASQGAEITVNGKDGVMVDERQGHQGRHRRRQRRHPRHRRGDHAEDVTHAAAPPLPSCRAGAVPPTAPALIIREVGDEIARRRVIAGQMPRSAAASLSRRAASCEKPMKCTPFESPASTSLRLSPT